MVRAVRFTTCVFALSLGVLLAADSSVAAVTHVVSATRARKWSYKGQAAQITIVGDLEAGDVVEVQVPEGIPHGFTAIKKDGEKVTEIDNVVLKCGEDANAKPDAVLKEAGCVDGKSQYGIQFKGSMSLEVLPGFHDDVPFWCVVHTEMMQGVLRLKGAAAHQRR